MLKSSLGLNFYFALFMLITQMGNNKTYQNGFKLMMSVGYLLSCYLSFMYLLFM